MQRLPLKLIRAFRRTINGITQERMSNACHVDADLVRSTRLQAALDMGEILEPCEHLVMGHCGFSVIVIDRHLLSVFRASSDWRIDDALLIFSDTVDDRLIAAGDGMFF